MSDTSRGAFTEFTFQPGERVGAGRFRLERLIGRGGMGTVWQAFDERLNESVALKFISEQIRGNPAALESMRREASRSHSLSHHHIVRIHDLHEVAGESAFISMEYVDGKNLYDLARSRPERAFALEEVWKWTRQLCDALGYAHLRGVIHRDLKPANLMLDGAGDLKLADFGLAAALRDPAQEEKCISGTPAYMSPQQITGAPAAVTDDIYSVGACLFELLAGAPLFDGPNFRRQIEFEPAPLLSSALVKRGIQTKIPEAFEDLLQQCLSKNPQNRPQTAAEFLEKATLALAAETDVVAAHRSKWIPSRTARLVSALVISTILAAASFVATKTSDRQILDLRNAVVRSSSFRPPSNPERAFDGLHRNFAQPESTRWAAGLVLGSVDEWIAVDLGKDLRIDSVTIDWELAYATDFTIRTRTEAEGFVADPTQWKQQGKVTGFLERSFTAVNEIKNEVDMVFDFKRQKVHLSDWMKADQTEIEKHPVIARHVLIHATALGPNNAMLISIYEIEIAAKLR